MDSINVEDQFNKENSVLSTYQDLIKFRRKFKSAILMGTCDVQEKVFHLGCNHVHLTVRLGFVT